MSSVRRTLYSGRQYLLRDDFNDDRAAGALNGVTMPAVPGPGNRTGVDTNAMLSIVGGVANFAAGMVANDGLWWESLPRIAGRMLFFRSLLPSATNTGCAVGWGTVAGGTINDRLSLGSAAAITIVPNSGTVFTVGAYSAATPYDILVVMRAAGLYWFIKGGAFPTWTLICITSAGLADGFPGIETRSGPVTPQFSISAVHVPARLWPPPVLAHDIFGRANGALGNTEPAGPDGQGAPILAWTGATWTIATNKAINTPVAGAVLIGGDTLNGNMETGDPPTGWTLGNTAVLDGVADERTGGAGIQSLSIVNGAADYGKASRSFAIAVGTWCQISGYVKKITANCKIDCTPIVVLNSSSVTWIQLLGTGRSVSNPASLALVNQSAVLGNESRYDDIVVEPLTLSELFASLQDVGTPNVVIDATLAAYTSGTQMGIVARLDSAATPANFIIANQDSANVKIAECVAGVYTNLATVASTFAASDVLRLDLSGANYRLYKVTSAGVATLLSASTTSILVGNLHGMFDTLAGSGNAFSKFTVFQKSGYSIPE